MERSTRGLRRNALQKLAALSAKEPSTGSPNADLERLSEGCVSHSTRYVNGGINGFSNRPTNTSDIPMSLREFEVLLALCKAVPQLQSLDEAERLRRQLSPYLIESYNQRIAATPFFREIKPSPWESLTSHLTSALLSLGFKFPSLRPEVLETINVYLSNAVDHSLCELDEEEMLVFAPPVLSFLGFLDGTAKNINFWWSADPEHSSAPFVSQVRRVLNDDYLKNVEIVFSNIRASQEEEVRIWKTCVENYDSSNRPVGAMLLQHGFTKFLAASTALLVVDTPVPQQLGILDAMMSERGVPQANADKSCAVEPLSELAVEVVQLLENGVDYGIEAWQQSLGYSVKAQALTAYACCAFLSGEMVDDDLLNSWLSTIITDPVQMGNHDLASATLKILAFASKNDARAAPNFISTLHKLIVEGTPNPETTKVAGKCLAYVLRYQPQDATITTLNTLGHVLSSNNPEKALKAGGLRPFDATASSLSLVTSGEEEKGVYAVIIETIVGVVESCRDEKMVSLGQSIMIQRLNKVNALVNGRILGGLAQLAVIGAVADFKGVLQTINKMGIDAVIADDHQVMAAVLNARMSMAKNIPRDSQLYDVYLNDLLESASAIGGANADPQLAPRELSQLISPLARLLSSNGFETNFALRYDVVAGLLRDFWFNCAQLGVIQGSEILKRYNVDFQIIAQYSPPLVSGINEDETLENKLDQMPILKRGVVPQSTVEHKRRLVVMLPSNEVDIRTISHPRTIFLEAANTLECLRAEGGSYSKVLAYFVESGFKAGEGSNCMITIASKVTDLYMRRVLSGNYPQFSAGRAAEELAEVFIGCCHRLEKVQAMAINTADRMIAAIPSSLCQRASLFALLELLTLLWISCLDEETDEYTTRSTFTSSKGNVSIELPDNYPFRRKTLNAFKSRAKGWVQKVLNIAPLDVKGLLQTYLSEFEGEDEGSFGHVSLGRSFALEMGSMVPSGDQKLASIEHLGDCEANTASDFVMQYTTRQAYRYIDSSVDNSKDLVFRPLGAMNTNAGQLPRPDSAQAVLDQMESKDYEKEFVPIEEVRDVLKKAAALVCRSEKDQGPLIRGLVGIPFSMFTKKSINLGISLWTGIIHEKPKLQTRMLAEIARNWEMTVEKRMGLYSPELVAPDAFDMRMEYAPSDKEQQLQDQHNASELLTPHLKLLHLLSSHYHANRHGNPHIQQIFLRLVRISLAGLHHATGHPLAREIRFRLVFFGLQVLRYSTGLNERQQIAFKDLILSAALSWFTFAPRWSFGGNKLQVKAEAHVLQDVANFINTMANIGGTNKNMRLKQDLLLLLVENEQTRLATWLYPLDHSRKHHLLPTYTARPATDNSIAILLPAAWHENPAIAVQLSKRFQSPRLEQDIRRLVTTYPEKVVDQPDAVQIMMGDKIASGLGFQLKYLLFWAPVNPITATTYFLPSYANNAFVLQYAMRSLESHSIDVTFFYVPQIVQTLRYDTLGYVERFILETAKFSQLFAHQIIWNMKANAFKDEDSTIPDPIKPTLDKVMEHLVNSFSGVDKNFYEREFSFFNEVTSISGKLRPYIKKTKPEKNAKIAEELAKIQVDVGVYLPSNPDGVVVDIDRTSGKSLQSHAKAPFMATFRIKKKPILSSHEDTTVGGHKRRQESQSTITKEVWQGAIFKVGDDCRQDMLALQLISAFRSIYNSVGLDVYVFPYRVTATAPGCGVIDVLPKSISRDMLGRDYEMGLYDYFISKYGSEDSIKFQEARNNFVKSMAGYSVISYLLKFKDRHNGNIMLDEAGHILHIDFGFCFDIAPGGITFERAPFKLTAEMVSVMGGTTDSQAYLRFEELCIKAFLAVRQYVDKLAHCVILMLDSGLPCFKPETIQNFRDRFVLEKSEREAADYVRYLVKKSYSSLSTGQYDRFQHLTNGIPY
ncbi:uncharacterized protein LAJ45_07912 [Morchella importuna]|uniref:uncharacterized protein n=1 Tax=Morchella importuna TaxID=1174673 RepID=UPI001E8EE22D|nr:uncharacterized protein LAJ45_07912 [Morchella importuna]KAH8148148.1 hypothetical protein LAJ45_07912 [Morchella importuna]